MRYRYHFELLRTDPDPVTGKREQVYITLDAAGLTRVEALIEALHKLKEYSQDASGFDSVNVLGFRILKKNKE